MTHAETPDETVARLVHEAREVASRIPFDQRAYLLREVVKAVRDAVKHDATSGGAPDGAAWELDGLAPLGDAAEHYYFEAVRARRS